VTGDEIDADASPFNHCYIGTPDNRQKLKFAVWETNYNFRSLANQIPSFVEKKKPIRDVKFCRIPDLT